jgi:predicted nucleic acid-binding Zn ribbon protein
MGTQQPQPIKEILKQTILNKKTTKQQKDIQQAWEVAVGKDAARHTALHSLHRATLIVSVDSPVWVFQLNTNKQDIEKRLQKQLRLTQPIKIKLRAGDTAQPQATP